MLFERRNTFLRENGGIFSFDQTVRRSIFYLPFDVKHLIAAAQYWNARLQYQ